MKNSKYIKETTTLTPGSGFSGASTIYKSSVVKWADLYITRIFIDLTSSKSKTTAADIIGYSLTLPSHIGQITAAKNGTIYAGNITCFETPASGVKDIDLYSATEGTGIFDGQVTALTETILYNRGGDWAINNSYSLITMPAADEYLYLASGTGGTTGTYTAGKFLITLYGA